MKTPCSQLNLSRVSWIPRSRIEYSRYTVDMSIRRNTVQCSRNSLRMVNRKTFSNMSCRNLGQIWEEFKLLYANNFYIGYTIFSCRTEETMTKCFIILKDLISSLSFYLQIMVISKVKLGVDHLKIFAIKNNIRLENSKIPQHLKLS
jgi:hypothetical protein